VSSYRSGFAEINGTNIYFEMKGDGHPLVMIHGQPLDSSMWDAQFEEFSKRFQTIRFDLASYGKSSSHNNDYSWVEDLKGILEFLEIKSTHLMGFSVGGMLAMDFTLAFPNFVDKLILVSTGLVGWSEYSAERQKFNQELYESNQQGNQENSIQLMAKWVTGPFRTMEEVDQNVTTKFIEMVRNSFSKERGDGKMILSESKTIDLVEEIEVPTLIISPDVDFPEFISIAKFLNDKIQDSEMVIIPETAHMINLEKPTEFNQKVLSFLE
jgi:3-oxoadipate enol-lactonase